MVSGQDLHPDRSVYRADRDLHHVEDHAVEIDEGAVAETDVVAVVADRRAGGLGAVPTSASLSRGVSLFRSGVASEAL